MSKDFLESSEENQKDPANRFRTERLTELAIAIFESEPEARQWLTTPKAILNNETPLKAMATDLGASQVEQMLYRIEYGIYG